MKLRIRNSNKDVKTGDIRKAANFYAEKLLSKQLLKNIELTIVVRPFEDKGVIDWLDSPVKPRQFRIILDSKYKTRHTLQILAHEMVHLKQFAKGELRDETLRKRWQFKKQDIDFVKEDYYFMNHEIEAFGMEMGLYLRMTENVAVGRQGVARSS